MQLRRHRRETASRLLAFGPLCLSLLASAGVADAATEGRRSAILFPAKLESKTDVTPAELAALEKAAVEALREAQFDVIDNNERDTITQAERSAGCYTHACMERIGRLIGAQAVVAYQVKVFRSPEGNAWVFSTVFYNVELAAIGSKKANECPSCTLTQATDSLNDVIKRAAFEDAAKPRGAVEITSDPTNATVTVNGDEVGVTPYRRTMFSGKQEIALRKPGYQTNTFTVDVPEGEKKLVPIKLVAGQDAADTKQPPKIIVVTERQPRPTWRLAVGGAMIGVGVAGIVYGATGLYLNGKPTDPPMLPVRAGTTVYDSLGAGLGGTVVGALLMGGGALLMALPGKKTAVTEEGLFIDLEKADNKKPGAAPASPSTKSTPKPTALLRSLNVGGAVAPEGLAVVVSGQF